MDYPLRSVIDCVHEGVKLGSVVVIRGKPIYTDEGKVAGYSKKYMQIRRGSLKGKECREFFDSILQWNQSFGIYDLPDPPKQPSIIGSLICTSIILPTCFMYAYLITYAYTH